MRSKKTPSFFSVVIILIVGPALFKQFDFENLEFEKPVLAIVYIVTLAFSIYLILRDYKNKPEQ